MTRVLVVSAEPVGAAMAGPAIRALELARVLARHFEVTLAAPGAGDARGAPVDLLDAGLADFDVLLEALRRHDVVLAQQLPPQLLRQVARLPVRYVADLYNPLMIEVLEALQGEPGAGAARRAAMSMLAQCAVADLVICASEKQRDLWLGGMSLAGLVDPGAYRFDPTYRAFLDVVPFGLPDEPPEPAGAPVLKGAWPGIGEGDRVLLWAGGIWNWLDALTPIRALERLRGEGHRAHLVFLGTGRPSLDPGRTPTSAAEAVSYARRRGLEGSCVHFNPGWVPYEERAAYLLEADLGVCAHRDHLEARFSFRTRVLDHFWAGLPSVVSSGDAIGELVEREGLGRAVPPGDDAAFAGACGALLGDPGAHDAAGRRIRELAPSLSWGRAAEPLVRFCREHAERPRVPAPRRVMALATFGQYPGILADVRERGGLGEVSRRVRGHVSRALRHGL